METTKYITVEKAVETLCNENGNWSPNYFTALLNRTPAEDVAPVVHARWVPIKKRMYACKDPVGEILTVGYKCSKCGLEEDSEYEYCHCGAKMDEEVKENDH